MSTSLLGLASTIGASPSRPLIILTALTGALYIGGIFSGVSFLRSPGDGAKTFGMPFASSFDSSHPQPTPDANAESSQDARTTSKSVIKSSTTASSTSVPSPTPTEQVYTQLHGLRDLSICIAGLSFVYRAWTLSTTSSTSFPPVPGTVSDIIARQFAYQTVATLLLVGVGFTWGDGWICARFAEQQGIKGTERGDVARKGVWGHVIVGAVEAVLAVGWLML